MDAADGFVRVFIADPDGDGRCALRRDAAAAGGVVIVGEHAARDGLFAAVAGADPDVLLLADGFLADGLPDDVPRLARGRNGVGVVLVFKREIPPRAVDDALAAGIRGYVTRAAGPATLQAAIRGVARGSIVFGPLVRSAMAAQPG
jgi:DNA-binding NarL/FixJ family response regulator